MAVTDKQLVFSGIQGRNLYTSDTAEAVDIAIEDGMLRGRQTDTVIPNVSGNITLSGTAIVMGDFAWGTDVYSCATGWVKNGSVITLPPKPTLRLDYDSSVIKTETVNWVAYHGTTSGDDNHAFVKNNEWWTQGMGEGPDPTTTHSAKQIWSTPVDFSDATSSVLTASIIYNGSPQIKISDFEIYMNDTLMEINSITEPDYTQWYQAASTGETIDWDAHGQNFTINVNLSNLETPAAVSSMEFRAPVWSKSDAVDGFIMSMPYILSNITSVSDGDYTYIATVTQNGIEGPISDAGSLVFRGSKNIVNATVNSTSGTASLYRAVAGGYGLVATGSIVSGVAHLKDEGQNITALLRPCSVLPTGMVTIWGNRVVVASGNTIYVSAAGRPTTFSEIPLNDDGLDGYAVTLGEPVNCLNVNDALIAYSPNSKYLFSGQTIYKGDRYGQQTPTHSPSIGVVAADGVVEVGADFVVSEGKVEYLPDVFTTSSRVLQRRDVYLLNGNKLYVKKLDVVGWITYTLPFTGVDLEFDGQYAVVSSSGSCLRIANGSTRFTSGHWLSGQMSSIGQLRAKWVMLRGDATVVVTNQTTSSTKAITDDTWNCSLLPSDSFNIKITPGSVYIASIGYEQTSLRQ